MRPSKSHPFIRFQRAWEISPSTWFRLGQCRALIQAISSTPLLPASRAEIFHVSLIKGAQATTAIEGNTLTEDEIRQISQGQSLAPSKRYMEQEVRNVLDALNEVGSDVLRAKKPALLTPELIRHFHSLIGKNLGGAFEAIPGQFRDRDVTVGSVYRAPSHVEVKDLMKFFCDWSRREFHFEQGQSFSDAIIQAIVSHVYIAWIHPFADGNGRTARLIEFYLLLRAGVPDLAAHILSNFYNQTRSEYYYQLRESNKHGNLTAFIEYALQGFYDGLENALQLVQRDHLKLAWESFIQETFIVSGKSGKADPVVRRRVGLILSLILEQDYTEAELRTLNPHIRAAYGNLSDRTFDRDLRALLDMKLLVRTEKGYRANTNILRDAMAQVRTEAPNT